MTDSSRKNTNKNYQEKDLSNFPPQDGKPRKKSEKKVLVFLVILVIVALPLSIWQINRQLKSPFVPKKAEQTSSSNQLSSATNTETPRIESLRTSDTDQDILPIATATKLMTKWKLSKGLTPTVRPAWSVAESHQKRRLILI